MEAAALFEQFGKKVYRVILRLVEDPEEAEDLTQETFIKVHRKLPALKDESKVASWIYRIATTVALDRLRQPAYKQARGYRRVDLAQAEATLASKDAPSLSLDRSETTSCVRQYAERLPEQYRVTLVLHDLEGLPVEQVAEISGSSVAATKVRLHRARKRMAALCSQECEQFYNEEGDLSCQPLSCRPGNSPPAGHDASVCCPSENADCIC
ncbi:MAG: RNA polymerase sigma factor [Dehalococcoidia bacterium]